MPLAPIQPKIGGPGAQGGLGQMSMAPYKPAPFGGQPNAAGMGPPVPKMPGPAGVVPPDSRSPFGPIGGPSATGATQMPPGGVPGYRPGPMTPPGPVGLQGLGKPPAMPPMAPRPAAPTAPLQPDASGVTPPPGTPQPPPPPTAGVGAAGPATTQTAMAAPAETADSVAQSATTMRTADAVPTEVAASGQHRPAGRDNSLPLADFSTPDIGKVVVPGLDVNGSQSGGTATYGDGGKKTDKGYQDAAKEAGFDVFDEEGALTKIPIGANGQIDPAFLAAIGFGNNPKMAEKMNSLPDLFRQWTTAQAEGNDNVARQAQTKILDALSDMKKNGLDLKPEDLFNYYSTGDGKSAWAPDPGEPVDDPPGIDNGTVDPITGGVDLGSLDLDNAKAGLSDQLLAWINKNPEAGQAILTYLGGLQSRDDRQTAIDSLQQGLGGLLNNDPTRKAMYDELGKGVQYTLDPATVEKMKTSGREMYGQGLTGLDQQLRSAAGAAGVPTNNLSALSAGARQQLLSSLLSGERNTDINAAYQNQADRQQYFGNLDRAQGSLLGPMAAYQGSLASLIAGTPGLASTGNPLAGLAEFRAYQDYQGQGPSSADRMGMYAGGLGSILGGVGGLAGGLQGK